MSYGAFVATSMQERRDSKAAKDRAAADRAAQHERAVASVLEHFPLASGHVCGYGVLATLNLWREQGEGKATLGQVKAERRRLISRAPDGVRAWYCEHGGGS